MAVIKEMNVVTVDKGLLDGGATHALRKCKDMEEWNAATPTQVILAEGTTSKMTLITLEDIQPIVPMRVLTLIRYKVEWKQEVKMVDSCPMVEARVALDLIDEMEIMDEKHAMSLAAMKMPMEELKDQELAMTRAPKENWAGVPDEIIGRVIPDMEVDGEAIDPGQDLLRSQVFACLLKPARTGRWWLFGTAAREPRYVGGGGDGDPGRRE